MPFDNPTNEARVRKMVETLTLIRKSARSNNAAPAEIVTLLGPLFAALAELGIKADHERRLMRDTATGKRGSCTGRAPQWASIRDMAEQANLKDLTYAMAVYLDRIDEALSVSLDPETKQGGLS